MKEEKARRWELSKNEEENNKKKSREEEFEKDQTCSNMKSRFQSIYLLNSLSRTLRTDKKIFEVKMKNIKVIV